jgi:hypothetical protein
MIDGLLEKLFTRHYRDVPVALDHFRRQSREADLGFDVEASLAEYQIPEQPGFPKNLPSSIYYFIPGTGFGSIKKPSASPDASTHLYSSDGIGLNMGCPIRLARAIDVLFSLNGKDRLELLSQLKSRESHLCCVEELLWLTLWKRQSGVTRGGELVKRKDRRKAKDIDWFFWSDGTPIYLEAKFRRTDWMRLSDGEAGQVRRAFLDDIGSKLPREKSVFQRCVAGITGFAQPDDSFFALCEKKLLSVPALNAILYRSLLGPITVCSLDKETVMELALRVREPDMREYPFFYNIAFNRQLQQRRFQSNVSHKLPEKGLLFVAFVPGPAPSFKPVYPQRFKIPKWSAEGKPVLEHVPPFLPEAKD